MWGDVYPVHLFVEPCRSVASLEGRIDYKYLTLGILIRHRDRPCGCPVPTVQYSSDAVQRREYQSLVEYSIQQMVLSVESFNLVLGEF